MVEGMSKGRDGSRGYILAMLLAIIVAMGILLTAALPSISTEVQRDQEAELIFRGEAIASAIRTYRAKTGGYPLTLEDLLKVRPPILRRLYRDPMTHDGEWDLITAVQPGASGDKSGLPIVGVKSTCSLNSFKVYQGKTLISDWAFSAAGNLLGTPGAAAAAAALDAAQGAQKAQPGVDPGSIAQGVLGKGAPQPTNPPPGTSPGDGSFPQPIQQPTYPAQPAPPPAPPNPPQDPPSPAPGTPAPDPPPQQPPNS